MSKDKDLSDIDCLGHGREWAFQFFTVTSDQFDIDPVIPNRQIGHADGCHVINLIARSFTLIWTFSPSSFMSPPKTKKINN